MWPADWRGCGAMSSPLSFSGCVADGDMRCAPTYTRKQALTWRCNCPLVFAVNWWLWADGGILALTELHCNTAFLIRVPFHVRVSRRQNANHDAESHYAQSSISCAALIIAVSTLGLWAVISLPYIRTRWHVCTFWFQPSVMKQQSSEWNEHHVRRLTREGQGRGSFDHST